MFALPEKGN
jgi:hypothetical protein